MSFDSIPEDKEESFPCDCGGNLTKDKNTSEDIMQSWECDNCNFQSWVDTSKESL